MFLDLQAFERGFLPVRNPLVKLPENSPFNSTLNQLAINLPLLLSQKNLRDQINQLGIHYPDTKILIKEECPSEIAIALLTLLMLAQGYVWEDFNYPANHIPQVLAENIYSLCRLKQRLPTLSYCDYILNNWLLIDSQKELNLHNIQPILTFTGSEDEAWFIKIHVVIEYTSASAIKALYEAVLLAEELSKKTSLAQNDYSYLLKLLNKITTSLTRSIAYLQKMILHCRPEYFYKILRIYLSGWENVISVIDGKECKGVKFKGVDELHFHSYRGSSGAQSSIIPALDMFVGIKHDINSMFLTLLSFKQYMPCSHQLFIAQLSENKVERIIRKSKNEELMKAWESIVFQLAMFRKEHLKMIHHYIFQPAKVKQKMSLTGTGGAPMSYLQSRFETTTSQHQK